MASKTKPQGKPVLPDEAYDRTPRVQLTITAETMWLTRFDSRGRPGLTYPVAPNEVARAFSVFGASTGLLPPDTLFWQQRGPDLSIGLFLPPSVRTLSFAGGKSAHSHPVPLPGLVFVGQGHDYRVYASPQRPVQESRLYHAPLPNVYEDGRICQGNVPFPRCTPETMPAAVQAFFESDFSLHLTEGRVRGRGTLLSFLRSIRGKHKFPADRLLPSDLTVEDLLNPAGERSRHPARLAPQGVVRLEADQPAPDLALWLGGEEIEEAA